MKTFFAALMAAIAITSSAGAAISQFSIGNDATFKLDGDTFIIKAAELHYPRIPAPYWDNRIKMCKALGMNTICLYVFWNIHEPEPGHFNFEGQNDLRHFVELCAENDMKVILRPGPYVCAEWEMGGLPWWLLRYPEMRLRQSDQRFLNHVELFEKAVAEQIADLTAPHGGPIIMVQVENEYGSYGADKPYVSAIRDMLRRSLGDDVVMFQCDWASNFTVNGLDDLLWTMNFGTGAVIDEQFEALKKVRPESPLMCSEFWSGWFDKWGARHETRPADDMIAGIDEMLSKGISFSLYMTHGGTNWGHWAGANSPGYAPDVTSYDYDAPIDESGRPTEKYHALRAMMASHSTTPLPDVPEPPMGIITFAPTTIDSVAPLFSANMPMSKHFEGTPPSMEDCNQGFGSIIYSSIIDKLPTGGTLSLDAHDYAQVFLDGELIGILDRRLDQRELSMPPTAQAHRLDILVQATGRINFGRAIADRKGIVGDVTITSQADTTMVTNWLVTLLDDSPEAFSALSYQPVATTALDDRERLPRGLYRGSFDVDSVGDVFLDMSSWGKGQVWVNSHPLGRFWEIGPQLSLYLPGCYLRRGSNEIVVSDILGPRAATVQGLDHPMLDSLQSFDSRVSQAKFEPIDFSSLPVLASATLSPGVTTQTLTAPAAQQGQYLCLEITPATSPEASIAEIMVLDADGLAIPRERWRIVAADSELSALNHTADKLIDAQESTFWSSVPSTSSPSHIVIDMGKPETVSAVIVTGRMERGTPHLPGAVSIYISTSRP